MNRTVHYLKMVRDFHYDTYLHSVRVAILADKIGEKIALNSQELKQLTLSALLHDIGKIKLSTTILNKPGKLEPEEWNKIKEHPRYGVEMLRHDNQLLSADVMDGIYSHHEFFNGKGYPQGLKQEDINVFARVIAIADAIDAMTTKRLYRPYELSFEDAIREVLDCEGVQFDPYICRKISSLAEEDYNPLF
ncbi:HD-GYP domain-containing protein [Syntrophomonas curvata]